MFVDPVVNAEYSQRWIDAIESGAGSRVAALSLIGILAFISTTVYNVTL